MVNTTERAMVSGLAERGSPKVVSPMINSAMVDICEIRRYFTWFSTYLYCRLGRLTARSAMSSVSSDLHLFLSYRLQCVFQRSFVVRYYFIRVL